MLHIQISNVCWNILIISEFFQSIIIEIDSSQYNNLGGCMSHPHQMFIFAMLLTKRHVDIGEFPFLDPILTV